MRKRLLRLAPFVLYPGLLLLVWLHDPAISRENGLMENLQALALLGSFLLSLGLTVLPGRPVGRFASVALAVSFLTLVLREVDLQRLNAPEILGLLGSGTGRNILLTLLWLTLLFWFARRRRELWAELSALLRTGPFRFLAAGCALYLVADLFDRKVIPLTPAIRNFLEEALENLATLAFLIGMLALTLARRPQGVQGGRIKPVAPQSSSRWASRM